jgi:O-antigen ligase
VIVVLTIVLFIAGMLIRRLEFWVVAMLIMLMVNQTWLPGVGAILGSGRWLPPFVLSLMVLGIIAIEHRPPRDFLTADFVLISWIGLALVSAVYSISPALTIARSLSLLLGYIAVFWGIWVLVDRVGEPRTLDLVMIAAGAVYGGGFALLALTPASTFVIGRFRGMLENPNTLGLLTALLLPLVLYRALTMRTRWAIIICAMMIVSLILTASRASLLAACVTSTLMLARARSRWLVLPIGAAIAISLGFAGLIPLPFNLDEYVRVKHLATGSGRLEVWPILLDYIRERPFFGYGFGTEDRLLAVVNRSTYFAEFRGGYAHNSYIGLTLQLGLVGSATFFLPLALLLWNGLSDMLRARELERHHAFTMTLLAALILSLTESWIYSLGNAMAFPFWIVTMLLVRHHVLARSSGGERVAAEPIWNASNRIPA